MKVLAFKFSQGEGNTPLEDLFTQIKNDELKDRNRTISDKKLRFEKIMKKDDGRWFFDLVKFSVGSGGPGKGHTERPIEGFDFGDGEDFAEETAGLYCPDTDYFILQYNHRGARPGSLTDYLNFYNHENINNYEIYPKFDEETERRFSTKGYFKRLEFTIAPHLISGEDKKAGLSLGAALGMNSKYGGDKITVSIAAGRSKKSCLSPQRVRETVKAVKRIISLYDNAVDKLEVSGKDSPKNLTEVMDFLGQKLCLEYDIKPGIDKRLPLNERWASLVSAYVNWKNLLG